MKTYYGYRVMELDWHGNPTTSRCVVEVCDGEHKRELAPRTDIRNHSPTGFEWGYGGSGPAQLALALIADCCGDSHAIAALYQTVKSEVITKLPKDGWMLTEDQVRHMVDTLIADNDYIRYRLKMEEEIRHLENESANDVEEP